MSDFIYYSNVNGINLLIGNFFYVKGEGKECHSCFKNVLANGYFIHENFKDKVHEIYSKYSNAYEGKEVTLEILCRFSHCDNVYNRLWINPNIKKKSVPSICLPDIENIKAVVDKPLMYHRLIRAINHFSQNKDYYNLLEIHRSIFGNVTINKVPYHNCKKGDMNDVKINICEIKLSYAEFVEQYKSGLLLARLEGKLKKVKYEVNS